ncbi:MAG: hypothetical protein IKB01_10945 [Lachnospiraceae bacterium]|nr:hypothetical protein [Lachnospiraceae bacterium]
MKKNKASNRRSRKYLLTINNPDKHENCSHMSIKNILKKWDNIIYWCMCDEVGGEKETLHTHLFIQFKNAVYFNSIKNAFPTAHLDICGGSAQECRSYIRKEGTYENSEKANTNLKETFEEFGTVPQESQGRRTDLEVAYQMIKDGKTNIELLEYNPNYITYLPYFDKVRLEILAERYRNERRFDMLVTYVYGPSGVGKSSDILNEHGDANVYRCTEYSHYMFDGYRGENVMVFEEFRSDIKIGCILNYLDVYSIQLPARYANKQACYHYVYIVSNWKLEEQYSNERIEHPETYQAFLRRIKKVRIYKGFGVFEEYDTNDYLYGFYKANKEEIPFKESE